MVEVGSRSILARSDFATFLDALQRGGYQIVGPTVRDGAIVYGPIRSETDLPIGWTDRQEGGTYRLERRPDAALFGYNVGPHSWKKYLFPPRERLFTADRDGSSFRVSAEPIDDRPTAYLGVRACELAAIRIQDRVFTGGPVVDPGYAGRRRNVLLIAVQCGQAAATCFCVSMGAGPAAHEGFDLGLTELLERGRHEFVIEAGTSRGAEVLAGVPLRAASREDVTAAEQLVERTARSMGRTMDTAGIRELLRDNLEHPRWDDVAKRCLSCTNCTMVCPTCFCSTTEEVPDLDNTRVERWRRWDSCFNLAFSELHGKSVRASGRSRYRQWMTHKLGTWHDQFGSSGCVGCGRCITWCPVGIDLTEEVAAIRRSPATAAKGGAP